MDKCFDVCVKIRTAKGVKEDFSYLCDTMETAQKFFELSKKRSIALMEQICDTMVFVSIDEDKLYECGDGWGNFVEIRIKEKSMYTMERYNIMTLNNLKDVVKAIMNDLETNCLTIECCDYSISGTLLTHCYYNIKTDTFAFTSGDMVEDKHAEELILNEKQKIEIFNAIIECYN